MRKLAIVVGVVAVTAIALATITVVGAKGGGFVRNTLGVDMYCWMDVKKATDGTNVRVGGPARFVTEQVREGHRVRTEIAMPNARELAKREHTVEFTGAAVKRIWVDGHLRHTSEGHLSCVVVDRRSPAHPGDPDKVNARFVPRQGNPWAFMGLLVRGDIQVYMRSE